MCTLLQPSPIAAATDSYRPTTEQNLFWQARNALRRGDYQSFSRYAAKLQDYPLYPYLLYRQLQQQLPQQLPLTIEAFLQRYPDTLMATRLRDSWLQHLAEQGRWKEYLDFYVPVDDTAQQCRYHYAQYKTGDQRGAWEGAKKLWLVGYSQDETCDPLFVAWEKSGGISNELRRQRIGLLLENGEIELARYIARPLDVQDKRRIDLWHRAYSQPNLLHSKPLQTDTALNRRIITNTLQYRALRAPRGTTVLWRDLEPKYTFSDTQRNRITRAIAIGHTYANNPQALELFKQLPKEMRDMEVCDHALRIALRTGRWGDALAWLEVMPDGENRSTRAMYWRGRIFEKMGFPDTAKHFFKTVSKERVYYGFLAADKLNLLYNLNNAPLQVDKEVITRVANRPDMKRAIEFYLLGLSGSARSEWRYAVSTMNREEMLAAGKLADAFGWTDRALLTLAKADHFDDLNIRFPLSYNDTVEEEAHRRNIDPAWIYAVVRQESAMMPFVQSHVGALGLMQLMPQTSREIARDLRLAQPDRQQLLKPKTNIHFGSYYLHKVHNEFGRNPVLATAAYNAGPHRIRKWYPNDDVMDADIWAETIPYDETRQYVRRVMAYSVFYEHRLNQPVKRLSERMRPVSKTPVITHCDNCNQSNPSLARAETTRAID
ncbi:MAG: transglycosylase SLT domain-containing protein [Pseudomonadota bacterium]